MADYFLYLPPLIHLNNLVNTNSAVDEDWLVVRHLLDGSVVEKGDTIMELEDDKVIIHVPAPQYGYIRHVVAVVGSKVKTGDLLAVLDV